MERVDMGTAFDTPQAVVLVVAVALVLLIAGGKVFASANIGIK